MKLAVKQEQTKKVGRPKVEGGRMRQHTLQIRLSTEELNAVNRRAKEKNVTTTNLVRGILTNISSIKEGDIVIDIAGNTYPISKDEAKQLLKILTEQLLA